MNCYEFMVDLHKVCQFQTKEGKKVGKASNSEIRRWLNNKVVLMNGVQVKPDDDIPEEIISLVMFPKNAAQRTTLW